MSVGSSLSSLGSSGLSYLNSNLNQNSAGISISGLSSGLNISGIIQALIQADSVQLNSWQTDVTNLQTQQQNYTDFQTQLTTFSSAIASLNNASTYQSASASVVTTAGGTTTGTGGTAQVLTATASNTASQGTYNVTVSQLAAAQKVATSAQQDPTSALNQAGTFIVNGKAVSVASSDTLTDVASKINSLGVGVTASIVNGGTGATYMTLTSNSTGTANAMQLADASGSVLNSLGLLGSSSSLAHQSGNQATSANFTSGTTLLSTMTGYSGSGSFSVNGTAINVNFATDSLQTIATQINNANTGVTATVGQSTTNGVTSYNLQLTGANLSTALSDPNGILGDLGVMQNAPGKELQGALDAQYTIDGLNTFTSSSNSVTTAIPGVTLNLTAKGSATVNVTQDTSGVSNAVNGFVTAYNNLVGFINTNSQLDPKTYQAGPLFGDPTVAQVQSSMSSMLFQTSGTGTVRSLADMGVSLNQDGTLAVNASQLSSALASNLSDVKNVLMSAGSTTASSLTYVTAGTKTQNSGAAGFGVNITQVATQGTTTAAVSQTQANVGGEILTFAGTPFGSAGYQLFVDPGTTQQDLVNKVNNDSTLKNIMSASVDGNGNLLLTSKRYGTAGNFTVSSNFAAASDNSGIGTTGGTVVNGVDVAGTINGEQATGSGQYLTGNSGNATTDGLEVQYTGTTLGTPGNVNFQNGVAAGIVNALNGFTDPTNGVFASVNSSLQKQIDSYNSQITAEQTRLSNETTDLQTKFATMESAMATMQSQMAQLAKFTG